MRRMLASRAARQFPWLRYRSGASHRLPFAFGLRVCGGLALGFGFFGAALFFGLLLLLGAFLCFLLFPSARALFHVPFRVLFSFAGALSSRLPASRRSRSRFSRSCCSRVPFLLQPLFLALDGNVRFAGVRFFLSPWRRWRRRHHGSGWRGGSAGVGGAGGGGATRAGAACFAEPLTTARPPPLAGRSSCTSSHPWSAPRSMRHAPQRQSATARGHRGGRGERTGRVRRERAWMAW